MKKLQVYQSAVAFANASLELKGHALDTASLSAFNNEKLDLRDWDYWRGQVTDARGRAQQAAAGKLDSELQDAEAAKKAAAK